jgi:hypothetical protein
MPAPLPPLPQPEDPPGSFLFSDEEIEAITDEERRHGRYTLARLPAQKHQSNLVLLKERRSFREIARLVSVAPETVQAVAQLHADELDKHYAWPPDAIGPHQPWPGRSAREEHGLVAGPHDPDAMKQ